MNLLLYKNRHLPEYITTMLCPYNLLSAVYRHGYFKVFDELVSPEEKFINVSIHKDIKEENTWGCPVFFWLIDYRIGQALLPSEIQGIGWE